MNLEKTKEIGQNACSKWFWDYDTSTTDSPKTLQFYRKLVSCGRTMHLKSGQVVYHCRKPLCPNCSRFWAHKISQNFMAQFPHENSDQFRMLTLGLHITRDPHDCIPRFSMIRDKIRKSISRRRDWKFNDINPWDDFALAGSLEIDMFYSEDFESLGRRKQDQYTDGYGYSPRQWTSGANWVVTFHGVVHLGSLGEEEIRDAIKPHSITHHLNPIYCNQDIRSAAACILGYSAKVSYETKLTGIHRRQWRHDEIREYASAVMRSRGRRGFKLCIKRRQSREPVTLLYS